MAAGDIALLDHNERPLESMEQAAQAPTGTVYNDFSSWYRRGAHNFNRLGETWGIAVDENYLGNSFINLNSMNLWSNDYLRALLISSARILEVSDGNIKSMIDKTVRYSIGEGIKFQSKHETKSEEIEKYVDDWAEDYADVTGIYSFYELQALALRRMLVDGDIGFIITNKEDESDPDDDDDDDEWKEVPQLSSIEPFSLIGSNSKEHVYGGVEANDLGRPMNYWVNDKVDVPSYASVGSLRTYSAINAQISRTEVKVIPAKNFILVHDPTFSKQFRGISAISAALVDARDVGHILDAEKIAIKFQSTIALIKTSAEAKDNVGFANGRPPIAPDGQEGEAYMPALPNDAVINALPGTVYNLYHGQELQNLNSMRPAASMVDFLNVISRRQCNSFGIGYEIAINPKDTNGVSIRTITADTNTTFRDHQRTIKRRFCKPILRRVIKHGIAEGKLPTDALSAGFDLQAPNPLISIDRKKDAEADILECAAGILPMKEIYTKRGHDYKDMRREKLKEADDFLADVEELKKKYPDWTGQEIAQFIGRPDIPKASFSSSNQDESDDVKEKDPEDTDPEDNDPGE